VVESTVTHCPTWCTNGQSTAVELIPGAVAELGRFINQLVEGREDIVYSDRMIVSNSNRIVILYILV